MHEEEKKMKQETQIQEKGRPLEAWYALWNAGLMQKNAARQFFRNKGTTETQFKVLLRLKYAGRPVMPKELSEQLMVDKSDLTGLADRMESAGLLRRIRSTADRRCFLLELTPKSEAILGRIEQPYFELIRQVMSVFSPEELEKIISLMAELHKSLDCRCGWSAPDFPLRKKKG